MSNERPPKEMMCHCTGFTKSCRELVDSEACQRWRRVPLEAHPLSHETVREYDCIDNHAHLLRLFIGLGMEQATHSIDDHRNQMIKVARKEIKQRDQAIALVRNGASKALEGKQ